MDRTQNIKRYLASSSPLCVVAQLGLLSAEDLIFGTTPKDAANLSPSGNLLTSMISDVKYAADNTPNPGMDEIYWDVTGGEVTLKKVTKKYHGMDFESEEISERMQKYEQDYYENFDPDTVDPEELLVKAREQYEKDKALREEVIRNRSKNNPNR